MEDLTFSRLLPIKPYVTPQWFVEFDGRVLTGVDVDFELQNTEVEILDDDVLGYGYDLIVSATDERGESRHYLANR